MSAKHTDGLFGHPNTKKTRIMFVNVSFDKLASFILKIKIDFLKVHFNLEWNSMVLTGICKKTNIIN